MFGSEYGRKKAIKKHTHGTYGGLFVMVFEKERDDSADGGSSLELSRTLSW